jgi:hypothetical protein
MLLAAVGLIAAGLGGTGTFASFTAETTNAGNFFATGTLFLHDKVGSGNACTSESNLNTNATVSGCNVLFNIAPLDAGAHWAQLTLTNAGSLNATDIKFDVPGGCTSPSASVFSGGHVSSTYSAGATVTTLSYTGLTGTIKAGDPIVLTDGPNVETFTAKTAGSAGSVTVVPGSTTAFAITTSATIASAPQFSPTSPSASTLCDKLQFVIVETGSGFTGSSDAGANGTSCAYGAQLGTTTTPSGGCTFDPAKTLGTGTGLPVLDTAMQALVNSDGSSTQLDAGASRYYLVGVKLVGTLGNQYQNNRAQFDLHWQIDQA